MTSSAALAAVATLVASAFCLSTLERWRARRRPHVLAWTIAMAMFALAALSFFGAAASGWNDVNFRLFYLFGAILNVPYLALGTVYLLAGNLIGNKVRFWLNIVAAFCAGVVLTTPITADLAGPGIPEGKEVLGVAPRVMAAVGSGLGAAILIFGALWSAYRLLARRGDDKQLGTAQMSAGRLAATNLLIAVGSIVLGTAGTLFGTGDQMRDFALWMGIGVAILFAGFVVSHPANPRTNVRKELDPYWQSVFDIAYGPQSEP